MTEPEKIAELEALLKQWREWAKTEFYDTENADRMTDDQLRRAATVAYHEK